MPTLSNESDAAHLMEMQEISSSAVSVSTVVAVANLDPSEDDHVHIHQPIPSHTKKNLSLAKVPSSIKSPDETLSSPTVTRSFLNSDATQSLLRTPSSDEEFSSFWSTLWPRLVKLGWTYMNTENDGLTEQSDLESKSDANFIFRAPSGITESGEDTLYHGIPQVLEVVEKIPSLSYYLTQMVLAESNSSFQNSQSESENNDEDEVLIMAASMGQQRRLSQDEYLQDQQDYINLKPLASVPFENWVNCVVKNISHGPIKGVVGKVVKIASGWITIESTDAENPIVFSKRAADLRVIEENDDPVVPLEPYEKPLEVKKKATAKATISEKKRKVPGSEQESLVTSSRRNVAKPVRYQDHAMLEKKKRKGKGATSIVPVVSSVASNTPQSLEQAESLDKESQDDINESESTRQLLSMEPQQEWLQRYVRVLAGPLKGKVGVTFKVHYGWVHVHVGNDEEACRRALDLELVDSSNVDTLEISHNVNCTSSKVSMAQGAVGDMDDTKNSERDKSPDNLLSAFPPETWPGMLVKVKFGGFAGNFARVLRVNNGWIHLSRDLVTDYTLIENYESCRRAFELEVVSDKSAVSAEDDDGTSQVVRQEGGSDDETDDSGSDSSEASVIYSPNRNNCIRSPFTPGNGRQSLGLGQGASADNPYANKKIMIGPNYQVSSSSFPDSSGKKCPEKAEVNHRLERLSCNCVWSKDLDIDFAEMNSMLTEFDISDIDWVTSLFVEAKRKGVANVCRHVRSMILETRIGHLKVGESEQDISPQIHKKKKRSMLAMSHPFHKKAQQIRKRKAHNLKSTLPEILLDAYTRSTDKQMHNCFKNSGWVQED